MKVYKFDSTVDPICEEFIVNYDFPSSLTVWRLDMTWYGHLWSCFLDMLTGSNVTDECIASGSWEADGSLTGSGCAWTLPVRSYSGADLFRSAEVCRRGDSLLATYNANQLSITGPRPRGAAPPAVTTVVFVPPFVATKRGVTSQWSAGSESSPTESCDLSCSGAIRFVYVKE